MSTLGNIRHTSRRLRRPDLGKKPAAPAPARAPAARGDLPMGRFLAVALVIAGSVGGVALVGRASHRPAVADAALPPPPPLVERPQVAADDEPARGSVAAAISVAEPLELPVRVDEDAGVVVVGHEGLDLEEGHEADELPPAERLPIARLDEHVRAVGGDEHLNHWLDLVDGRRVLVDRETAEAVRRVMPFRATYDRGE